MTTPLPKGMTIDQVKDAVLDNAFNACLNDNSFLYGTLEWAYRDYTDAEFLEEYQLYCIQE